MIERVPGALWLPGPLSKTGYHGLARARKSGQVNHSAEGYWDTLMRLAVDPSHPASWHLSVRKDGLIAQHYELSVNCWHSADADDDGGVAGNIDCIGIEFEGVTGEPLTEGQVSASVDITVACMTSGGFHEYGRYPMATGPDAWCLAEHRELSDHPTSCPSGRIPWNAIMTILEDKLTPQEQTELDERRAKAELDFNLLTEYRSRYGPNGTVELLHNSGASTGIYIPIPRKASS